MADIREAGDMLTAPRQVAPLSTSMTTSLRPSLHWRSASGTDGARVEICRDRACMQVEHALDVTGTSASPPTDLTPGVHFWRLYGRAGTRAGAVPSPTWEFFVGRRSASRDTSWGTVADFNGDGYADLAVGAHNGGVVLVSSGSATGLDNASVRTLTPTPAGTDSPEAISVASAGDVNGDGYPDLVVGTLVTSTGVGRAYVYLGGTGGLAATPATTLMGPADTVGEFGRAVTSAGDVNGDGYADIVVADPQAMNTTGRTYIYLGGASGLAATPATRLTGPGPGPRPDGAGGNFGTSVASAGDVNSDGYADIAVGAPSAMPDGRAYVYLGSATGLSIAPASTLTGADPSGRFGSSVARAGDVNGDGYADLAISAPGVSGGGRVYVYVGGASGLAATPVAITEPDTGTNAMVGGAGDVNGDGYADLAVGDSGAATGGRAYVYLGSASGLATTPATTLRGADGAGSGFGNSIGSTGDVNGDGFADLAVGHTAAMSQTGLAYVYLGAAGGLTTMPATTVTGPGMGARFGQFVASAWKRGGEQTTALIRLFRSEPVPMPHVLSPRLS